MGGGGDNNNDNDNNLNMTNNHNDDDKYKYTYNCNIYIYIYIYIYMYSMTYKSCAPGRLRIVRLPRSLRAKPAHFGRGDDTVGSPHRAQTSRFELFERILLWKLDRQFPVEQTCTSCVMRGGGGRRGGRWRATRTWARCQGDQYVVVIIIIIISSSSSSNSNSIMNSNSVMII